MELGKLKTLKSHKENSNSNSNKLTDFSFDAQSKIEVLSFNLFPLQAHQEFEIKNKPAYCNEKRYISCYSYLYILIN